MKREITIHARFNEKMYLDRKLTPLDKLIMTRIICLTYQKGYCWITNKTLAKWYGVTERSIERCINNLKKEKYIKADYTKIKGKSQRKIYLTDPTNMSASTRQICRQVPDKYVGHNIMNRILNMNIKSKPLKPEEEQEMKNLMLEFN